MEETFYQLEEGMIPTGLPGGFFIYEADCNERILFADKNIVHLYGCDDYEEFIDHVGGSFKGMVHPDDLQKIENQIKAQTVFVEKRHDYVRYRILTRDGEVRYIEDFGHILHWKNGRSFYYVFIVDVDKNEYFNRSRNSYAEAEILSADQETDPLTGLFNMSFFYQKIQNMLQFPYGRRQDLSFVQFDIPNFKLYNERHGFKLGDELLCDLARTISETFEGATVARFSDDHFFVCDTVERDEVIARVEEVYKRMLLTEDLNKKVRVKAGIYFLDDRYPEVGLACDHARLACNSVKSRHDVNYCIYDEMLRERLRRQQYVVDHIDEAVEKDYIKVFYQPVIRVKTGKICGYEALVRWKDPKVGLLSPGDFIETLEQFHLIHIVDRFVVKKVCMDYKALVEAGEPVVPVSLNISRLDFELCDIFGIIEKTRAEYDVPRDMLDIEITESALNDNVGYIKSECEKMRALGYRIWLDDFGSGYSSLNTIAEYDFDVLKLDLIFLRSFDRNPKTGTLMCYIMEGARGMGLQPLCEGVETTAHYEFLKKAGCELAQGFYFGKPMPMQETRALTCAKGLEWETEK
ncbi:GGDEF and EAL domain-containing protein [Ruminococcus albus]|uniref:GGDEF and EAL domain-containing protein n=1 Tax=Ruminococcus albus TaxID=1264 RepID=UPI000945BA17|nr:GGDEF and EAL domain-containing protein [Ruminococcus albus]